MGLRSDVAFAEDAGEEAVQFRYPGEQGMVSREPFLGFLRFLFFGFNQGGVDVLCQVCFSSRSILTGNLILFLISFKLWIK